MRVRSRLLPKNNDATRLMSVDSPRLRTKCDRNGGAVFVFRVQLTSRIKSDADAMTRRDSTYFQSKK